MLEISIPSKPTPVPPAKYLPLTKEEQEEADFYKKRKSRYGYLLFGLIWLLLIVIVSLILDSISEASSIVTIGPIEITTNFIYVAIFSNIPFPFSLLPSIYIVDNIPFLNPSKAVKIKLKQEVERKEEQSKREWEIKKYNNDIITYNQKMEELEKLYPGLKQCNYDSILYSRKISSDLLKNISDFFDLSKTYIKNESNVSEWIECNDREFEIKTARWYELCGYKVKLTPKSNDGGIDVIAQKGAKVIYIQCKQYKNAHVPVSVARELYGVMAANNVKHGAIICLSGGDKGTIEFSRKNNIDIITANEICNDITTRISDNEKERTNFTITKNDISFTYKGYGTFEIIYEPFSDIYDLISYLRNHYAWNNEFEFAIIKWRKNIYVALKYKKEERRFLSEQLVEYIIDNKSFNYHRLIEEQVQTKPAKKKTYKRRYYNRWY